VPAYGAEAQGSTCGSVVAYHGLTPWRKSVADTINELAFLSRKLNQKSDTLNDAVISINRKLRELNFGVSVWLSDRPIQSGDPYYQEPNEDQRFPMRDVVILGYCKTHDEWQLAVKDVTWQRDERGAEVTIDADRPMPLLRASRAVRYKAVRLIPELLEKLKSDVEKIIRNIDQADRAARAL
jgi:hypothetical protein